MARRALMAEVSGDGTSETEVRLDGWCKGGLRQQENDGGGCATMRERSERLESPGAGCTKVLAVALANGDRIHHDGCSG